MNGNLKGLTVILSICFSIGGLVWGASSLSNNSSRNSEDIEVLRHEQKDNSKDLQHIREDLASLKAQMNAQTNLLKTIQLELRVNR